MIPNRVIYSNMIMLNRKNENFFDILYHDNKIIKEKNNAEKNISEELLTIRTLVLTSPFQSPEVELAQLEKILLACKLQKEDYKVDPDVKSWAFYRKIPSLREILLFGISEKNLNLNLYFNENQINRFDNKIFIKTSSITQMMSDQQVKNELWQNALKPCFIPGS